MVPNKWIKIIEFCGTSSANLSTFSFKILIDSLCIKMVAFRLGRIRLNPFHLLLWTEI